MARDVRLLGLLAKEATESHGFHSLLSLPLSPSFLSSPPAVPAMSTPRKTKKSTSSSSSKKPPPAPPAPESPSLPRRQSIPVSAELRETQLKLDELIAHQKDLEKRLAPPRRPKQQSTLGLFLGGPSKPPKVLTDDKRKELESRLERVKSKIGELEKRLQEEGGGGEGQTGTDKRGQYRNELEGLDPVRRELLPLARRVEGEEKVLVHLQKELEDGSLSRTKHDADAAQVREHIEQLYADADKLLHPDNAGEGGSGALEETKRVLTELMAVKKPVKTPSFPLKDNVPQDAERRVQALRAERKEVKKRLAELKSECQEKLEDLTPKAKEPELMRLVKDIEVQQTKYGAHDARIKRRLKRKKDAQDLEEEKEKLYQDLKDLYRQVDALLSPKAVAAAQEKGQKRKLDSAKDVVKRLLQVRRKYDKKITPLNARLNTLDSAILRLGYNGSIATERHLFNPSNPVSEAVPFRPKRVEQDEEGRQNEEEKEERALAVLPLMGRRVGRIYWRRAY